MEHLLHYVWKHKLFPLRALQTTEGLPVEVIDTGLRNSGSGPDFFNARLRIDGMLRVGDVEIHARSSDRLCRGHHGDRAYGSVILCVVGEADGEVPRTDEESVPQMVLPYSGEIEVRYRELCFSTRYPACHSIFSSLSGLAVHSWMSALQAERLEQKAALIHARLERCDNNWEDAFFITLARNYGFGLNGNAFEKWAEQLPFRALDKHRDDLFQIEAFFYGLSGLLEETFLEQEQEDEYSLRLRKEFRYLQRKFEISRKMDASLWRFLRLRPDNYPHVRLAQLAYYYQNGDKLFSRLMEAETLPEVRNMLSARTSFYWENHYTFGHVSRKKEKTLGERSKDLIIINTVVPFLYAYGLHKANERMCGRAGRFLEELKAEDNRIIRSWSDIGLPVANAADSQALIQLQKEYCDKRKCLYCRFGYEYMRTDSRVKN
ncbi:DUF2851 family protein [uncultured Bacteroides sp.]|uniref:DUF2851 family protein n=1 Tax=uncultured Bacteroides sp. TaxID=162156 RepID=UPI002676D0C0|nr:DUF2851 family protein [uncultured Bacteroides sp.]